MKLKYKIFATGILFFSFFSFAESSLALTLASTFDCISVIAPLVETPTGTEVVTLQHKASSSNTWLDAYTPIIDTRTMVGSNANPYVNQVRGSIVGLTAGTSYDVRVVVSQSNGDVIRNYTGTVSTLTTTVPLGGATWYVDDVAENGNGSSGSPFNTIASGIAVASPGDTIYVRAGTYAPFTVSKSGNENAWIAIIGENRDATFISGGAVTNNVTVSANFIQMKNLRLKQSLNNSVYLSTGAHHIWLDNLYHEDISSTKYYNDAGVQAIGGNHHIYVLNNLFYSPSSPPASGSGMGPAGIYIRGTQGAEGTWVIKGNTFNGAFRDAIGNSPEQSGTYVGFNTDVANNTFLNWNDDAIQVEGDDINLRIWGNNITFRQGTYPSNAGIATESSYMGPVYIFRNVLIGATAFKISGAVYTFYFHNTIDSFDNSSDVWAGAPDVIGQVLRNNIAKASRNILYRMTDAGGGSYDYNLYWRTTSPGVARHWKVLNTDYNTPALFYAGTGQEQHGIKADPLFIDGAKRIDASSPAYNAGVVLANFNDANSSWPYRGTMPDMGAYEVISSYTPPSDTTPPQAPSGVIIN